MNRPIRSLVILAVAAVPLLGVTSEAWAQPSPGVLAKVPQQVTPPMVVPAPHHPPVDLIPPNSGIFDPGTGTPPTGPPTTPPTTGGSGNTNTNGNGTTNGNTTTNGNGVSNGAPRASSTGAHGSSAAGADARSATAVRSNGAPRSGSKVATSHTGDDMFVVVVAAAIASALGAGAVMVLRRRRPLTA